jgi:MBG domain (YGX type)
VTADSKFMTYCGSVLALTYTYTGLVNGDSSAAFTGTLTTTATSSSSVAPYPINQGSLAATGNYTIGTFQAGTLTVKPAVLEIGADSKTMTYGGKLPVLTVTYTGLVNGNTGATFATHPNTAPKLSTVAATSQVGQYAITVSGATDPDYTITYVRGTLTINPARLTITAVSETITVGSALPPLAVTYTGLVDGDTLATFATSHHKPPKLSTTAKAKSPIGTYVITVAAAYDPDYVITYVYGTLTIKPLLVGRRLAPS